ncbi:6f2b909d-780d-4bbc-83da-157f3d16727c [Thermothielavioides terrestris]|uniref:6f2b909d-780d-4bbc-83da-157f3d16727c n=1 Tax=Thermothielavioides terrestris TaxID=2587410 RepID=A0A3S5CX98_9PEZI|nr:6f2b909d-780d-4bbc-83da-157f3d16727c [Thermothielavioides terrestris]
MPTTEIITIINNSGKVISTGKQLVNIFKEAQAAYRDRKEAIKAERAGIRRAKTFDVARSRDPYYDDHYEHHEHYERHDGRYADEVDHVHERRRRSYDDGSDSRSHASSRYSRYTRRSHRPRSSERRRLPALTEGNLKAHSEVSATSPSKAYRSPYAETAPRDMQLSRPTLAIGPPPQVPAAPPAPVASGPVAAASDRQQLARKKSIDMNLAYGDIPPDLASRVDLDPPPRDDGASEVEDPQEKQALTLMDRIEGFLEEAQCVHDTASSMIESLQRNPEAAAAVALSLAELSALLGKMSPAFLAFLKGGSPAVFALLASPQFLIGAGVAVGVTVVMFGGWKIVKRIKDSAPAAKVPEAPFEMRPAAATADAAGEKTPQQPASAASYDEALVLQDVNEELSTIETWRRGIVPFGADEAADVELMSREAERALREMCDNRDLDDDVAPCDSVSQVSRARTERSRRSHRTRRRRKEVEVPERKSSKKHGDDDGGSEAVSERSHRSQRSSRSQAQQEGSTVSRSSKHTSRTGLKAIEEGEVEGEAGGAPGKPKEKKRDMIKQLFKMKKDKEARERAVSVLV